MHWPRHALSELSMKCACVGALCEQLSPVASHSSGSHIPCCIYYLKSALQNALFVVADFIFDRFLHVETKMIRPKWH